MLGKHLKGDDMMLGLGLAVCEEPEIYGSGCEAGKVRGWKWKGVRNFNLGVSRAWSPGREVTARDIEGNQRRWSTNKECPMLSESSHRDKN